MLDSPYRAAMPATLLVEIKNVSNSCQLTDRYHLVVDSRFLGNVIKDSRWPAPSFQRCLDSTVTSQYIFSIQAKKNISSGKKAFDVGRLGLLRKYRDKIYLASDRILLWRGCLFAPKAFHCKVLSLCHDHPSAGHFAVDRTWDRLSELYFWPNGHDDVVNWVQSCISCTAYKPPPNGYRKEPLQPIQCTECFELVFNDLAGPFLPETPSGNNYAINCSFQRNS